MPVTKSQTTLAAPISQELLITELKLAFTNAGFTLIEDYTATDRLVVFSFVLDATKTFGTIFLRIRITSALAVSESLGTAWNTTTKVLSNESVNAGAVSFITTSPIDFIAYSRGIGVKIIQISQGTSVSFFGGFFRPETKPDWWNENTHPYAFIPQSNNPWNAIYSSSVNPYNNATYSLMLGNSLTVANAITGKRDVIAGLILTNASGQGMAGKTSTDIAVSAANGLAKLDTLQVSAAEEYTLLFSGTNGIALRTV